MKQKNLQFPSTQQVQELFRWRCPKCRRASSTVHELEPRSRGENSLRMQNRTAICSECHAEFHRYGASAKQILAWKEIIYEYLFALGPEVWETYLTWGNEHSNSD